MNIDNEYRRSKWVGQEVESDPETSDAFSFGLGAMMLRLGGVLAALMFVAAPLFAGADLVEKNVVVLKAPLRVFGTSYKSKSKFGVVTGGQTAYTAKVEHGPAGVVVNGSTDWSSVAWPSFSRFVVDKIKTDKKKPGWAEVSLKPDGAVGRGLTVELAEDSNRLFDAVFLRPDEVKAYKDHLVASFAAEFFNGPLASLTDEQKRELLRLAIPGIEDSDIVRLSAVNYKDTRYLAVNLGTDDSVYNEEKLTQAQRLARILNDKLLSAMRSYGRIVRGADGIHGIKMELRIPHESFIDSHDARDIDRLELYAPSAVVYQFIDADITSKKLLEACIVLVNGNRTDVSSEL